MTGLVDLVGFVAAALVLLTFCMTSMVALRVTALLSNVAFFAYGYLGELAPVAILHAVLIPLNLWRLAEIERGWIRPRRRRRDLREGRAPWPPPPRP